jgi:DNA-binding response OmpR family regulator
MARRILLCDDEIHILRAAEFTFTRAGYEVRTAGDGEEGWEAIGEFHPDFLITDCQMPRLDGLGLIQRIRENPPTAGLLVMMLTAKGFELSYDELARKWNILALVAKPFSPRDLLHRVNAALDPSAVAPKLDAYSVPAFQTLNTNG